MIKVRSQKAAADCRRKGAVFIPVFKRIRLRDYIYLSLVTAFIFFIFVNILLHTATRYLVNSYERRSLNTRAVMVRKQCTVLANDFLLHHDSSDQKDSSYLKQEIRQMAGDFGGRILIVDNRLRVLTDTYGACSGCFLQNKDLVHVMRGSTVSWRSVGNDYIEVITPIKNLETGQIEGAVLAMAAIDDKNIISTYLVEQRDTILGIFLLVSLILSILIWLLIFRSFRGLQKPLEDIAAGHQEEELPAQRFREFIRISDSVNRMMSRANDTERSRQEFVSNVSHELKTPITSMKILADSLLDQKDAPVELYKEFMTDIVHEIDRENQIITDLLTLVKMDKTETGLNISAVNINEMLEVLLKRISPIAAQRNITIRLETMRDVVAEVDEVKIALACNNLIVNAVKYNYDDGLVSVSLNADHKFFYIRVKDTGCGIPEESQEMIFERFYRVDKARSRETGGTGLGLAITRKVLLMHKGSIRVHSREGEGSTFTIRVPLNYVA